MLYMLFTSAFACREPSTGYSGIIANSHYGAPCLNWTYTFELVFGTDEMNVTNMRENNCL